MISILFVFFYEICWQQQKDHVLEFDNKRDNDQFSTKSEGCSSLKWSMVTYSLGFCMWETCLLTNIPSITEKFPSLPKNLPKTTPVFHILSVLFSFLHTKDASIQSSFSCFWRQRCSSRRFTGAKEEATKLTKYSPGSPSESMNIPRECLANLGRIDWHVLQVVLEESLRWPTRTQLHQSLIFYMINLVFSSSGA